MASVRPASRPPRATRPWLVLVLLLAGVTSGPGPAARAQDPPPPASTPPSADDIQQKLDAVDALTGRDDAAKAALREAYQRALASLAAAREHQQKVDEYQKSIDEAPAQLGAIREELQRPAEEPKVEPPKDASVAQLEQQLKQAQLELDAARNLVTELQAESTARKNRRTDVPATIAAVRRLLEELPTPPAGGDPLRDEAERLALQAQRHALQTEATRYEKELASYDARTDLLPARRDRAQRRAAEAEKRAQAWQTIVDAARAAETAKALDEAKKRRLDAAFEAERLKELAEENVALAAERGGPQGITSRLSRTSQDLAERKRKIDRLTRKFQSVRSKVNLAGLTNAMSVLLRKEYGELEVTDGFRREQKLRRERISEAQLRQLELDDQRVDLFDVDAEARRVVDEIDPEGTREDRAELEAAARSLLANRKEHLDALLADYLVYLERLVDLERTTATYVAATDEYREYLQERIFSVRSVDGSLVPSPTALFDASLKLVGPATWAGTMERMASAVTTISVGTSVAAIFLVLVLGGAVLARKRLRARLRFVNEQVRRVKTDAFRHSVEAFAWTLVLAIPLPLTVFLVGKALEISAEPKSIAGAVGLALVRLSPTVLLLDFVRHAARREGLAGAHFQWADAACRALLRLIRWFGPLYLVALGVAMVMQPPVVTDRDNDSLGRVAFAVAVVALALFLKRVLDPTGPILSPLVSRNPSSILVRFRYASYFLAVAAPLTMLVLTAIGYDFTAAEIHGRFLTSLQFLTLLAFVYAMAIRWLDVARRRVALEHARLRREAARAAAGAPETPKEAAPAFEEIDLPAVNAQTMQLLKMTVLLVVAVGLWGIWAALFPALRVFDRVQIWPTLAVVQDREEGRFPVLEGLAATSPSASTPAARPEPKPAEAPPPAPLRPPGTGSEPPAEENAEANALPAVLTLADLGLSILFVLLTLFAAKNVPGLVEIVLLRRLQLDPGARYAVSTIAQYAIVVVGVTLAFGALSISWKSIQWLAAALTFGLAFGLQEIFANFVSGLIMLFERPVRIGDIVSVGNVTGTVARIRMRATTITDFDNRELIVPNREFITSQLVNWTLTDTTTREVIKVGIAYGSDPEKARDVLLKACQECPVVLGDPPPSVIFRQFGDSALILDVRVFIATRDHWAQLMDDLHNRLYRACRDAGIEIAFPQLDVHIRSGLVADAGEPPAPAGK